MRTLAFLSTKGGSGKSTLCLNIGAALAKHFGQRVLIIDLDGMACVTSALASEPYQFDQSIGEVVLGASLSMRWCARRKSRICLSSQARQTC